MFEYNVGIYQNLPEELQTKVAKLKDVCFKHDEFSAEKKAEHEDKYCSEPDRIRYMMAMDKNEVVGLVIVLKRKVSFGDREVVLGGLGGVCTHPNARRKGIASALLKKAMDELKRENCEVVFLCTDIDKLAGLYEQVGFKPLGRQYTYLGKSGKRYFDSDGMMAPVNSEVVFKMIMADTQPFDIGQGNW